jgi:hypothetical protein
MGPRLARARSRPIRWRATALPGLRASEQYPRRFATREAGDALDLVRASLGVDMGAALAWARCWLGVDRGEAVISCRPAPLSAAPEILSEPDRWRRPWQTARPIAQTLAASYLATRGPHFDDPRGRLLRFAAARARQSPTGELEHHPALLCALADAHTGEQCGIINIYLRPDGSDRLRDRKGKTVTGRAKGAAVMLSEFDEPTAGLIVCEGLETGIAIYQSGLHPIWACGGAGLISITCACWPARCRATRPDSSPRS